MFATSSQRRFWIYANEAEILKVKEEANSAFVERHGQSYVVVEKQKEANFLSASEELTLIRHAEFALKAFCLEFKPPMPTSVMACSLIYLKRIYLKHSVMDFKPNDIIPTCVYLACKVDEFNVSLREFVSNLKKDREKSADVILWFELPIMQILNYQLTVHSAYRPLEGLLINLKTHAPDVSAEALRAEAELFLDKILLTDAYLLHAPAQIALAALVHSAEKSKINIKFFLSEHLMRGSSHEQLNDVLNKLMQIRNLANQVEKPSRSYVKAISEKLERCRNQEYNPSSAAFRKRVKDLDDDDDFIQLEMYKQDSQEQLSLEDDIMSK